MPTVTSGVIGVGTDLVEIGRLAAALERRPGLIGRLFTGAERAYCESARVQAKCDERFAVRFAAKEAAMKALGLGLRGRIWHDIEVVRSPTGMPGLRVGGRAATIAADRGGSRWVVSLTHTRVLAHAVVLLVGP